MQHHVDGASEFAIGCEGSHLQALNRRDPPRTFVETLQRRSSEAGEKVNQLYASNREQLAEAFGTELTTLPGESRERTLNALAMALTPEGWIVLRERLGLTVEQAREEWRFIVKAIFKETGR